MAMLSNDVPGFLIDILHSVDYSKITDRHYDDWVKIIKDNIGKHLKLKTNHSSLVEYYFPIRSDLCVLINQYDFNSLSMAKQVMFGEIGSFADREMFDSHKYGYLYFDGKDHGIEFFAFVHTDAYDSAVFAPDVREGQRQAYLDGLLAKAIHKRDIGITTRDRILLLSTCSSSSTNGRDILIGRITEEVFADPAINSQTNDGSRDSQYCFVEEIYLWPLLLIISEILLITRILVIVYKRKSKRSGDI